MNSRIRQFIESKAFNRFLTIIIILNAIIIAADTELRVHQAGSAEILNILSIIDAACLVIYIIEAILKIFVYRIDYFKSGWNIFDFLIVVVSILPFFPFDAKIIRVLRVLRIVRTLRIFSVIKDLQRVLEALGKSIPAIASTLVILLVTFFIYAIIGVELFSACDPEYFGDTSTAFGSLFRIATLDNWTEVSDAAVASMPFAWIYFVSFVVIASFVVINIIVGIIVDAMETSSDDEEARDERNFTHLNAQMAELQEQLAVISAQLAELKEDKKE